MMLGKLRRLQTRSWGGHRESSAAHPPDDVRRNNAAAELDGLSSVKLPFELYDEAKSRHELSCIERLEKRCKRRISVATTLAADNLKKCLSQEQSRLWKLPAEIRNIIWQLVTMPEDAETTMSDSHKIHTDMMKTCRRAWLEVNGIALPQTELRFSCSQPIYGIGFAQDPRQDARRLWTFLRSLTENNRHSLDRLRVSAPLWWYEGPYEARLPAMLRHSGVCPRVLTLVVNVTPELLVHVSETGENQSDLELGWLKLLLDVPWPARLEMIRLTLSWTNGVLKQLLFGPQVNLLGLVIESIRKLEQVSAAGTTECSRRWVLEEPLEQDRYYAIGSLESGFPKNVRSLVESLREPTSSKRISRTQSVTLAWKSTKRIEEQTGHRCSTSPSAPLRLNYSARKCRRRWDRENSLLKFSDEP